MKTLIIPFVLKRQKNKLTRLVDNTNNPNILTEFKKELKTIYDEIKNPEIDFIDIFSQVLNSNVSENHYIARVNNKLILKFININKIPQFQTVESIANAMK